MDNEERDYYTEYRQTMQLLAKAVLALDQAGLSERMIQQTLGIDENKYIHITETDIHEQIPSL